MSDSTISAVAAGSVVGEHVKRELASVESVSTAFYLAVLLVVIAYLVLKAPAFHVLVEALVGVDGVLFSFCHYFLFFVVFIFNILIICVLVP